MMVSVSAMAQTPFSSSQKKEDIAKVCDAVAQWQIAHHSESRHHILDWTNGALYRGMTEWGQTTDNQACYDFVYKIGSENKWNMWDRVYHADDICVGQAFIEMYRKYGDQRMLRPALERAYWVATHPSKAPLRKDHPIGMDERWSWCDALFMAAPVYAALYSLTGDKVYVDYMDSEFKACTDSLYDRSVNLYYRDCIRIPRREPNGAKQFWGRGNGWVFGSIPLILENLPMDHPTRHYYIEIFCEMAQSLLKLQDENGAWHSSLLDPVDYPLPENSASAFFTFGIAWGLNNGYLSARYFGKALSKAWDQLVSGVSADGKLGYIQPVGAAPKGEVGMGSTDVYGVGAFLLAGSEMYKRAKK